MVKDLKKSQALRAHSLPYRPREPANTGAPPEAKSRDYSKLWTTDLYAHTVMNPYMFVLFSNIHPCKQEDKKWVYDSFVKSDMSVGYYTPEGNSVVQKAWDEAASEGKQLPALMMRGRIVADFPELREWINSGDLERHVDEACWRAEVYLKSPPLSPNATIYDMPYIPGYGINWMNITIPPWADLPPPIPASELPYL